MLFTEHHAQQIGTAVEENAIALRRGAALRSAVYDSTWSEGPPCSSRSVTTTSISVGTCGPSLMVGAGVPRLVVSKILNHFETGGTAVYDRHGYDLEKRAALDFWGKRLDQIVSGKRSRVLAFAARA